MNQIEKRKGEDRNMFLVPRELNACHKFNTGEFNDIVYAYVMEAMKAAEVPEKKAIEVLDMMYHAFDEMTAEEALTRYRNSLPGAPLQK